MRPSFRSARLRASPNPFVCLRCRAQRLAPFSPASSALIPYIRTRNASTSPNEDEKKKVEFTEKLRRKIWGTDNPPGQRDPYKQMTPEERELEQAEMELEREQAQAKGSMEEEEIEVPEKEDYKPATTWDGLVSIGGPTGWWEEAWDQEHEYKGYLTRSNVPIEDLPNAVRKVAIEMIALQQAGRPLTDAASAPLQTEVDFDDIELTVENGEPILRFEPPMEAADLLEALEPTDEITQAIEDGMDEKILDEVDEPFEELSDEEIEVAKEETEGIEKRLESAGVGNDANREDLGRELTPAEVEEAARSTKESSLEELRADSKLRTAAEAYENEQEELLSSTDEAERDEDAEDPVEDEEIPLVTPIREYDAAYLTLPLTDLTFRFAFIKRLTLQTGLRIPDPAIASFTSIGDILTYLQTPPPPKRLADILMNMPSLTSLPNVEIFPRRHTPVDKEKTVGRWKVIEKELQKRGLPVLGHAVQARRL